MKLKGNIDSYLMALEDEIKRVKHQKACVPEFRESSHKSYDEYLEHLENLKVEACLLLDFEEEDDGRMADEIMEVNLLRDDEA